MGEMVAYQTYADMDERRLKADKEIEQLKKERDRYYKALIEIAGFEGVDFDGSQIAIEALKER